MILKSYVKDHIDNRNLDFHHLQEKHNIILESLPSSFYLMLCFTVFKVNQIPLRYGVG